MAAYILSHRRTWGFFTRSFPTNWLILSRSPADICKKMEKEFKRLFQKMLVGQEGETKQALRSSAWEAIKQTEENLALCIIC